MEDASFFHWCKGWFRDWDKGPLSIILSEGPVREEQELISGSEFLWFLRKIDSEARILHFSTDYQNLITAVALLPRTQRVLVYGSDLETVETLHKSNDSNRAFSVDDPISVQLAQFNWSAWTPTRWSFQEQTWAPSLGRVGKIPADPLEEFAFIIKMEKREFDAEILIGFDIDQKKWRIFDREYREQLETNKWIDQRSIGK